MTNNSDRGERKAVIAGAGPAGLTAAMELLRNTDIHPVIYEMSGDIGGISKTVKHNGNRIDIGGHRFFSKNDRVMSWWRDLMPLQSAPALDDLLLDRAVPLDTAGNDPQVTDRVMLVRNRVSRIYYLRKFFDYPISLSVRTFANMGLWRTAKAGVGYLWSAISKRREDSLEDFYINRFGAPLYGMFFEDYTEKVWGVHPSRLGADWGAQRVKGLSIFAIIKDMLSKSFGAKKRSGNVETSLIEEFIYPKLGPGQLWETAASDMVRDGGELHRHTAVKHVNIRGNRVESVTVVRDGKEETVACDYFMSSMPLKDLIASLRGVEIPDEVSRIAAGLPYRDFITVGLLVDRLAIKNETRLKTYASRVPDTWIYVQERDVRLGRIQVFNNWSPYMVKDYKDKVWIGLEYFCQEGDELWSMDELAFIDMAVRELVHIGIITGAEVVRDAVRIRIQKAYPAYFGTYYELDKVRNYLDTIDNLYCIGRNGQHRYNNMDHSMLTAMEAVDAIASGSTSKANVWNVNTETEYHEEKK